tara:strand:- start:197 stop:547 length:351 start_codon:yes stop_codon:yes gene_type:complete
MEKRSIVLITTLYFLILTSNVFAGATGKLKGTVNDDQGNSLVGVNIYLDGTAIGTASDESGNYLIINVPAATYTVVVSYVGFQTIRMTDVIINADHTIALDFQLMVSAVEGDEVVV